MEGSNEVLVSFRRNNTTIQIWARTPGCAAALTRTMYHVIYKSIPMNGGGGGAFQRVDKYSLWVTKILRKNNVARLEQKKKAKVTIRHFASVLLSVHIKFAIYLPKKNLLEK